MADFYMRQGNRLPSMQRQFVLPDGSFPDLSGFSVTLVITPFDSADESSGPVTIVSNPKDTDGNVLDALGQYDWTDADALRAFGTYNMRWRAVDNSTGQQISFPNDGTFDVLEVSPP